jgi:hypothetical protein
LEGLASSRPTYTQNIASSRNYVYDPQGNLIKDKAEQIAEIEWTVTGNVKAIFSCTGLLDFILESGDSWGQ